MWRAFMACVRWLGSRMADYVAYLFLQAVSGLFFSLLLITALFGVRVLLWVFRSREGKGMK